jgi:hypothetical protein
MCDKEVHKKIMWKNFRRFILFVPKKLLHVSNPLGHHQVYIDSVHLHNFKTLVTIPSCRSVYTVKQTVLFVT